MKVIVVGAGIVGLATAWALLRSGHVPVVLDQGPIPNPLGASHDQHRLIRHAYGDEIGYTRMVGEAFDAWARLFEDLGEVHYVRTGAIAVSSTEDDETDRTRRTWQTLGIPHAVLDRQALDRAMPQFAFEGARYGLLDAAGGPLLAARILEGLVGWLKTRGVIMRANARVAALQTPAPAVVLENGEVVAGDRLVLASGAWTSKLLPALAGQTAPSRQVVVYVEPPAAFRRAWAEGPVLAQFRDGLDLYNLPPVRGLDLKFSCRPHRRPGDPDDPREPAPDEGEAVLAHVRPHLRDGGAYRVLGAKVCYYGLSDTGRFIVEPLEGAGLAITNCCGHMFKFGAMLGERIAATVVGGHRIEALQRLAAGQAVGARGDAA